MHACVRACVRVYVSVCMCVCVHVFVCECGCMHACVRVYVCMCLCVCVCVLHVCSHVQLLTLLMSVRDPQPHQSPSGHTTAPRRQTYTHYIQKQRKHVDMLKYGDAIHEVSLPTRTSVFLVVWFKLNTFVCLQG